MAATWVIIALHVPSHLTRPIPRRFQELPVDDFHEPQVLEALYPLLLRHGSPEYIHSDNGPEFVAEVMQDWLQRVGIKPIRIYPGSP